MSERDDERDPGDERELIEIQLDIPLRCNGWRLDRFVQGRIPRLSRTRIQKMLRAQEGLGGSALRPAMRVVGGQALVLLRPAPDEPDVPRDYGVLYEDAALIAIDKPAGLPVHATARYHKNTLTALLRERFDPPVPRLVHRIDRETSGVLLLARDREVEVALKGDLAARRVEKTYLAIVHGDPGAAGSIDDPIGPDPESGIRIKMRARPDGAAARTRFRRLELRGGYALIEARPESGRQHQIRVHLSAHGTPIVGDKLYGPDPTCMLEYLETGWTESLAARLELPRHALHASRMTIHHPKKGEDLTLEAPLPPDLLAFWDSR